MEENERQVYAVLERLGIEYTFHRHPAVYTVAEAEALEPVVAGQHAKNLFLRGPAGEYFLVVMAPDRRADLKALAAQAGVGRLHFATEAELRAVLNLGRGEVTPFGLINDPERRVRVLVDRSLAAHPMVGFHPNTNTATVIVSYAGFRQFLEWSGHRVEDVTV